MRLTTAFVAVAVAVAVTVTGCATRVVDGVPTADPAQVYLPTSSPLTTSAAPAPVPSRYVDVSGQGDIDYDRLPQRGHAPAPGITVNYFDDEGAHACTIGPGTDRGYLTAGHCTAGQTGVNTQAYTALHDNDRNAQPAGWITDAAVGEGADAALFRNASPGTGIIARTWPVAGVLTVEGVRELPKGTPICYNGAQSGVVCGRLLSDDPSGGLSFLARSQAGDSGAPIFIVDGTTGAATLIGLLNGGRSVTTVGTYLDPQLARIGVRAIVNSEVAIDPTTPGYSTRVKEK